MQFCRVITQTEHLSIFQRLPIGLQSFTKLALLPQNICYRPTKLDQHSSAVELFEKRQRFLGISNCLVEFPEKPEVLSEIQGCLSNQPPVPLLLGVPANAAESFY